MKKIATLMLIVMTVFSVFNPSAAMASTGLKEGASSLLIPGWGQYQNGEFDTDSGKLKGGVMIAIEIAAIVTTATVGGVAGYPQVWAGIGLFLFNHIWSSIDAYANAEKEPCVRLGTSSGDQTDTK